MGHAHRNCLHSAPVPLTKTIPERPAKHKLNTNTTHTLHQNSLELIPSATTSLTHKPQTKPVHPAQPKLKPTRNAVTRVFGMLDHKKNSQSTDSLPSCFYSRSSALSPSPSLPSLPPPPTPTPPTPTTQSTLPLRPTKRGLSEHCFFSPTSQTSKPFSVSIEGANPMLGSLFRLVRVESV
jgi:hypothetical protein